MSRLITLLVIINYCCVNGQNLIPNPSFESYKKCPENPTDFNETVSDWFRLPRNFGTSNYFNVCALWWHWGVPQNYNGYEYPSTGNAYVGTVLYNDESLGYNNFREYFEVKFDTSFISGKTYTISFKASLADYVKYATDDFGIFLSDELVIGPQDGPLYVTPHWKSSIVLEKKIGWTEFKFEYRASSNERYMVVGNFYPDSSTTHVLQSNYSKDNKSSYVYFDDFYAQLCETTIDLGKDTTLCIGDTLVLGVNSSNFSSVFWQDKSTDSVFHVTDKGIFWVVGEYEKCIVSDTIRVEFIEKLDLGEDTSFCQGDTFTLDAKSPYTSYIWDDGTTNSFLKVYESGTYSVEFSNLKCSSKDSVKIQSKPLPNVHLGRDTTLCYGQGFKLSSKSPDATYLWQNGSTKSEILVLTPGLYQVWVDLNGCSGTDKKRVFFSNCGCSVFLPTSFTPNGDDLNEAFIPIFNCTLTYYRFRIYNTWGGLIYQSSDPKDSWDGTFKDVSCPAGTYVYHLEYETEGCKRASKRGKLNLLR